MTKYYFAPTETSKENLLAEKKASGDIYVTGNTGIDALKTTVKSDYAHPELDWAEGSRLILITAHRRENLGEPMHHMFRAIRRIVEETPDVKAIYPIHLNPLVRKAAKEELEGCDRIRLIDPLDVLDFHNFLARSFSSSPIAAASRRKHPLSESRSLLCGIRRNVPKVLLREH